MRTGVALPRERFLVVKPEAIAARPSLYLTLLSWAFAICSSTRLLSYLPTVWAIHESGDSTSYSLLTWCSWVASNATMAAWLYESNRRRVNRAILVTAGNAVMCVGICVFITCYR